MKVFSKLAVFKTALLGVFLLLSNVVVAGNILIVMSDEDHLNLKGTDVYQTGFYLNVRGRHNACGNYNSPPLT